MSLSRSWRKVRRKTSGMSKPIAIVMSDRSLGYRFQEVDINTEAAVRISNALASSSSVSYLRLVENNLGDKGLEILSEGIRENESLQHLE